jgi:hypothetical protein
VSTNIAETSITVNDVVYVIDSGQANTVTYDPVKGISALVQNWVSRANTKQRQGRKPLIFLLDPCSEWWGCVCSCAHLHTHAFSSIQLYTLSHTHTHSLTHTCTYTLNHTHSLTHAQGFSLTHSHTRLR